MLSEEKISIMTRLAICERKEGKQNASIRTYFRGDYIGMTIIKAIICASICYVLIGGMVLVYYLDKIMDELYTMDYLDVAGKILSSYLLTVGIYAALSYLVGLVRYHQARKNQKKYMGLLHELSEYYRREKENGPGRE